MTQNSPLTHHGYCSGHCWYYLLGGAVLTPKQIWEATKKSGYKGYAADDIAQADSKIEPKRSAALRQFKAKFEDDLKRDIARYRQCALEQRWSREFGPVVKVDRMTRETIQNDKEKEPFGGVQSQGCA